MAVQFAFFKKHGLVVLTASYGIAIFLPMIMHPNGSNLYHLYGYIRRYQGFDSSPFVLDIAATGLLSWGVITLLAYPASYRASIQGATAILISTAGFYLTVTRIGLLFSIVTLFVAAVQAIRIHSKRPVLICAVLAIPVILVNFTTSMMIKAAPSDITERLYRMQQWPESANQETTLSREQMIVRQIIIELRKKGFLNTIKNMNNDGRHSLTSILLRKSSSHGCWGGGTGASVRYLRSIHFSILEPHNDYLRIYFDFGWPGLLYFLVLGGALAFRLRNSSCLVLVVGLAVLMLTDNMLVYPSFGYGPMLLAGLLDSGSAIDRGL